MDSECPEQERAIESAAMTSTIRGYLTLRRGGNKKKKQQQRGNIADLFFGVSATSVTPVSLVSHRHSRSFLDLRDLGEDAFKRVRHRRPLPPPPLCVRVAWLGGREARGLCVIIRLCLMMLSSGWMSFYIYFMFFN